MTTGKRVLLPTSVYPRDYHLFFDVSSQLDRFKGEAAISLTVRRVTRSIHLHALKFDIQKVRISHANECVEPESIERHPDGVCIFNFAAEIPVGNARLTIDYEAEINPGLAGFYRSSVAKPDGGSDRVAVTQMCPIDARQVFPCWDEPGIKSHFHIKLTVDSKFQTVSNMPIMEEQSMGDRKQVRFEETPLMSTYLVCLMIGEFEWKSSSLSNDLQLNVYCCPGKRETTDFALQWCEAAVKYYNEYFGLSYPLPKLDLAAIPDFACGAMENWGLVTFREIDLLCDPLKTSTAVKTRIATVICHEVAHQWFGNLVTMSWWDDVWLNEGFASYMETKCVDAINPEWLVWNSYMNSTQAVAMKLDSLRSSHPIQVEIGEASEVEEVFDAISYRKGASVIKMCVEVMGDNFQEGLRLYMKKHQYGNTETRDLWAAFDAVTGTTRISEMMTSWTTKKGYPLVTVEINWATQKMSLRQQYFLADGSEEPEDSDCLWDIPLFIQAGDDRRMLWLTAHQQEEPLFFKEGDQVKFNAGHHVPIHVMVNQPQHDFSIVDQIGTLNDTIALTKSGHLPLSKCLALFEARKDTQSPDVLLPIVTFLGELSAAMSFIGLPQIQTNFRQYCRKLVMRSKDEVICGNELQNQLARLRQLQLSALAPYVELEDPLAKWVECQLDGLEKGSPNFPVDLRRPLLMMVSHLWPQSSFHRLKEIYVNTDDSSLRQDLYHAMGFSGTPLDFLDWSLTPDVRPQDLLMHLETTPVCQGPLILEFFEANFDRILEKIGSASCMFTSKLVRVTAMGQYTPEMQERMVKLWRSNSIYDTVSKTVAQMEENVRCNELLVGNLKKIEDWAFLST